MGARPRLDASATSFATSSAIPFAIALAAGLAQAAAVAAPWSGQPQWWLQLLSLAVLAALYFGALVALLAKPQRLEDEIPFELAIASFYAAARDGLRAQLTWSNGESGSAAQLLARRILPLAREGLARMEIEHREVERWLAIIEARVESGRNGAWWQRAWAERHGNDPCALVCAYRERQQSDRPVHEWDV